jgi:hypothetical protein
MEHRPAAALRMTRTEEFAQESVLADGKSGVWVAGLVQYATGSGADVKNYLLDWTGKKWHVYSSPEPLGAITSDGHGGPPTSSVRRQWRPSCAFHGGRWQQDEIPVPETSAHDPWFAMSAITRTPKSDSIWAVGAFAGARWNAIIYQYGG